MSLSGLMLSISGCQTPAMIKPYEGPPFFASIERLDEYEALKDADKAPKIRAWIREADRVIRSNNALRD